MTRIRGIWARRRAETRIREYLKRRRFGRALAELQKRPLTRKKEILILTEIGTQGVGHPSIGARAAAELLVRSADVEALSVLSLHYVRNPSDIDILRILVRLLAVISPKDTTRATLELLRLEALSGQKEAALKTMDRLLSADRVHPATLETCAHAARALHEHPKAQALFHRFLNAANTPEEISRALIALLRGNPEDSTTLEIAANTLEEAGRPSEAARMRKRASVAGPAIDNVIAIQQFMKT